ncbi:hypothetical protein BC936DRAFT_141512 [Jimgerdemannia flammicorona]|uniref:Uncharacterized protein n=2 Tax=Jimgerdemannia flammicorona TaxID=994334 RepID=A0A433DG13_9FUNG|nr:hypothetical protein BC936DRAFT_141512 [Jimgerdemannia flammicorona]RUS32889.1 hypothetical protein BC938DRAFT_473919 [Jimgerdemannia flammicorona]
MLKLCLCIGSPAIEPVHFWERCTYDKRPRVKCNHVCRVEGEYYLHILEKHLDLQCPQCLVKFQGTKAYRKHKHPEGLSPPPEYPDMYDGEHACCPYCGEWLTVAEYRAHVNTCQRLRVHAKLS